MPVASIIYNPQQEGQTTTSPRATILTVDQVKNLVKAAKKPKRK